MQMDKVMADSGQRCWCWCSPRATTATVLVWMTVLLSWNAVNAEEAREEEDSVYSQLSENGLSVLTVCAASVAFLLLAVYVLASCTDCYKSEVSTDFHPATGQSQGVKWGGSGGYNAAASSDVNDSVLGAGFTGEVVVPGQGSDQALPYTMIPSQVPEAQGFRGYGSVPAEQGLRGYGGGGGGGMPQQHMPGAHVSPVNPPEPEEPPPSYFSAAYQ
ncbi:uncharacterized protein LOC143299369 [Babylonia areolata]|uniref:uncharacterized protein LOC143299369 n=1 Tax=Babylonia areolata TaxID=304850 RepID=UPI003FCF6DB5